jgi:TubC N-terminal docking domain
MTAASLVGSLSARGVRIWEESGRIEIDTPKAELGYDDIALIRSLKPQLIAYLSRPANPPVDWRETLASWPPYLRDEWSERAGISEFDGGLTRELAEESAFRHVSATPVALALARVGDDPEARQAVLVEHGYVGPPVSIETQS